MCFRAFCLHYLLLNMMVRMMMMMMMVVVLPLLTFNETVTVRHVTNILR